MVFFYTVSHGLGLLSIGSRPCMLNKINIKNALDKKKTQLKSEHNIIIMLWLK